MCKTRFGSQGVIPDVFLQDFVFEKTLMAREIPPPPFMANAIENFHVLGTFT